MKDLKWECSDCGGLVERHRPPAKCPHCGTAGVIFVRADPDDGGEQPESFREAWLRAGLEVAGAPALR